MENQANHEEKKEPAKQEQHQAPAAPQLARPPASDVILKVQFFKKFLNDANALLLNNGSSEAGIARMKLAELDLWGTNALLAEAQSKQNIPPQAPAANPASVAPQQQEKPEEAKK